VAVGSTVTARLAEGVIEARVAGIRNEGDKGGVE
jgi:hypothetical protein